MEFPTLMGTDTLGIWVFVLDVTRRKSVGNIMIVRHIAKPEKKVKSAPRMLVPLLTPQMVGCG